MKEPGVDNSHENDIDINDVDAFIARQDEVRKELDGIARYANDIAANSSTICAISRDINSAISGISGLLSEIGCSAIESNLDYYEEVYSCTNDMMEFMRQEVVRIDAALSYTYLKIMDYEIDPETESQFQKIMQGSVDWGVFWAMNAALSSTSFKALAFLTVYGTDGLYDDGNFVVGDIVKEGTKLWKVSPGYKFLPQGWGNALAGSVVVSGWSAFLEYMDLREGGITDDDIRRIGLAGGVSGLTYLEWTAIAGAIGGVPGAIVASLVAYPTTVLLNDIKDYIVGDYLVDYFYSDGVRYDIYYNGTGKEWDFGLIAKKYSDAYSDYLMYNDLEEYLKRSISYDSLYDEYFITDEDMSRYLAMLDKVEHANSWDEAYQYFLDYTNNEEYDSPGKENFWKILFNEGFNLEEFYNRKHNTASSSQTTQEIYEDFEAYMRQDCEDLYGEYNITDEEIAAFKAALEKVANAKSWEEAYNYMYDEFFTSTDNTTQLTRVLFYIYGFNLEEYFNYTHTHN